MGKQQRRLRSRTVLAATMAVLVAVLLVPSTRGAADPPAENVVVDWNAIASTAIMAPPPQGASQPPHAAVLSLGMVQGAVYDAVNAIDGGHQPYLVAPLRTQGPQRTPQPRRPRSACSWGRLMMTLRIPASFRACSQDSSRR